MDSSEGVGKDQDLQNQTTLKDDCAERLKFEEDKRIGYTIRLLPSRLEGVIIRTKVDKKGVKKLVVKTTLSGDVLEINDLPYLYEVLQRETKKTDESEMVVTTPKVNVNDNTDVLREYNKAEEHDESVEKSEKMEPYRSTSEVEEIENIYLEKDGDDTRVEFSDSHIIPEKEFTDENRNGKTWTEDEEELIKNYFQEGKDYATIAKLVGRTELAIKSRLAKLGLIDYTYGQDESIDDLEIEHVYLDEKGNTIRTEIERKKPKSPETEYKDVEETIEEEAESDFGSSVKIGTRVRLFPSQVEGVVVNHLISKSGEKRFVIEKDDGTRMTAQDHPYLYKIVKKRRKRIGETENETNRQYVGIFKENESTRGNVIKEQFRSFLSWRKPMSTANRYTEALDHAVREWIKKEVDSTADSIFSYTSSEDVRLCIDMLKSLPEFLNDNVQKHRNMSAALDQYLLFIEEREKGNL